MKHEKVELISPESSSSKLKAPPQKWSPATLATLKAVKERTRKRDNKRTPNVVVKYYDNTYTSYDWLVSGWIVEERFVPTGRKGTGRTYKYYYDPTGRMYYTKRDVLFAWKISKLMKSKIAGLSMKQLRDEGVETQKDLDVNSCCVFTLA